MTRSSAPITTAQHMAVVRMLCSAAPILRHTQTTAATAFKKDATFGTMSLLSAKIRPYTAQKKKK
jgi:hypothetical protein